MISIKFRLAIAFVALAVISFTMSGAMHANASVNSPTRASADEAARIKPEEVRELLKKNKAVLVDVRGSASYKAGHIKGALNIPYGEIVARAGELPRDKMIVTYCSWPAEHTSAGAVTDLKTKGITNAAAVLGGYDALVKAGFATETGDWAFDKIADNQVTSYFTVASRLFRFISVWSIFPEVCMRLLISIMAVAFLALILLAACNSHEQTPVKTANPPTNAPAPAPPPGDNVRRITPAELKTAMASNSAIIIDVRGEAAYKDGHIKGARQIPFAEILAHVDELPRDKTIATYCSWPAEHTSAGAVTNLKTKGINNAAAILGGFEAMKNAGFEVVKGLDPDGK